MLPRPKDDLIETDLIAWAIPLIAQGHYSYFEQSGDRELIISDRYPSLEEMEGELFNARSDEQRSALIRLREDCNINTIRDAFHLLFGPKLGEMCSVQFEQMPEYSLVIAFAYEQEKRLIQSIQRVFVRGREGLSEGLEFMESKALPEAITAGVVSYYAKEIGSLFPRLIRRAEKLRTLQIDESAPNDVQNYLEEASKCYIYGRFTACLVICRSAIEFALRERLAKQGNSAKVAPDTLANMISLSRSVLPLHLKAFLDDANKVRIAAKKAVHTQPPDPETCMEMFLKTRGILRELYSKSDSRSMKTP